jgi:hypothetical protein
MTKQEQIEEMAVIGCVRNPQAHTAEECAKCDFKQGQCNAYRHAEKLYNAGYRKAEEVRKETAEKILNELIDSSNKITFFDCRMALGLDKLTEQYGVEVEE